MLNRFFPVCAAGLLLALVVPAQNQPAGVVPERNVTMSAAVEAATAAVDKCRADGFRVSAVVVDRGGNVKAVLRDDGAATHTVSTAQKKAFTSFSFRINSSDFITRASANPGLRDIKGVIALGGGVPLRSGNEVIGAIGIGGAPSGAADEVCAQAGVDRIAGKL
jgi:uncharacterized protein GlcG (DUF336 family)